MQLSLTGHHIEITDSLRDYVSTKLGRLERHFDQLTDVHCVLTESDGSQLTGSRLRTP